ncbi:MAG: 3D domain-containing protein [archaeon]
MLSILSLNEPIRIDVLLENENVTDFSLKRKKVDSYYMTFEATAYDLSVNSCGKKPTHPAYGVTASGYNISGQTREESMTIAVDPNIIELGTKVEVIFPKEYSHFDGIYTARDTGSAIKGKIIDVYMGDFQQIPTHNSVWNFGRRKVKIRKVE